MGVAELIPGISGATVAVIFKIYPNLMTILSNLRVKNLTLDLRSLSQTFQFNVSLPLIISMIIAVILCSKGINYLMINFEELFLTSLGLIMIVLSIYIIDFFKEVIEEKKLIAFLLLGAGIGFSLQEINIEDEIIDLVYFARINWIDAWGISQKQRARIARRVARYKQMESGAPEMLGE